MPRPSRALAAIALLLAAVSAEALAQQRANPAPDRRPDEGEGPFERLIIRGATVIDGTGAPPRGPMDIVIEGNRIVEVKSVGYPGVPIDEEERPQGATHEIDAHGSYVLPGFVDIHMHIGSPAKNPDAEYVYKLWMAHGITTAVGVPLAGNEWTLSEKGGASGTRSSRPGSSTTSGLARVGTEGRSTTRRPHGSGFAGRPRTACRA